MGVCANIASTNASPETSYRGMNEKKRPVGVYSSSDTTLYWLLTHDHLRVENAALLPDLLLKSLWQILKHGLGDISFETWFC